MAQWLRLCPPNAGGLGSNPGQGTRSHMLQLKTQCSHIYIYMHFMYMDSSSGSSYYLLYGGRVVVIPIWQMRSLNDWKIVRLS